MANNNFFLNFNHIDSGNYTSVANKRLLTRVKQGMGPGENNSELSREGARGKIIQS